MLRRFFTKHLDRTLLITFGLSLLVCGFSAGALWEKYQKAAAAPGLQPATAEAPEVPVITLEKIENGVLYGKNSGEQVRFLVGPENAEIFPEDEGAFSFPVLSILPNLKQVPAPAGMQFVGSSRGSKFYPLDAPDAAMLSPANRIFFRSAEEAVAQGYTRGE